MEYSILKYTETDGEGFFESRDCMLVDNGEYSHFEESDQNSLAFFGCYFGKYETDHFYVMENVYIEDCFWEQEAGEDPEFYYDIEPTYE